jgi:hydroxymethylglutaryl-CoA synthase
MVGITACGAYIPLHRLGRQEMGQAWGIPAVPGERSVANADEDSLTMAVTASLECLVGQDLDSIDAVYFATTTSPYTEKQCASIIAAALDLRKDVFTADFTDSLRSATVAIRAARDAIESGSARNVLVAAADCRPAEPETMWEQLLGDGAGALLLSKDGGAAIRVAKSVSNEMLGQWRRAGDRYVRAFEPKLETEYAYVRAVAQAGKAALQEAGVDPKDLAKAVISAGDPRSHQTAARALGVEMPQLQDTLFLMLGGLGTAQLPIMLTGVLETAKAGDKILVVNHGDGADALVLEVTQPLTPPAGKRTVQQYMMAKKALPSYDAFVGFRQLMERERFVPKTSPVTYWRDAKMELALYGGRCRNCGIVQYPSQRVCGECYAKDAMDSVKLSRKGSVFTFTLDHLVGGGYLNVPVPRLVVDLEGGGRIFLEMTDGDPKDVKIGMPVELTFRCLHEGTAFHNYYWKCQPVRVAA